MTARTYRAYVVRMTDVHLSRLFEWALRRIGTAFAWSLLAAFVCGMVAAFTRDVAALYLAGLAAPIALVLTLVNSKAPMPYTSEDLEATSEKKG